MEEIWHNITVLSNTKAKILAATAIHHKKPLKADNIKQAFILKKLSPDEQYILRPPAGCPNSKPNAFWLLLQTLYGLKCSSQHWYETFKDILNNNGPELLSNDPCIFTGVLIEGEPKLYIYVNDFIYFSASNAVKRKFEELLGNKTQVDFIGKVTQFRVSNMIGIIIRNLNQV